MNKKSLSSAFLTAILLGGLILTSVIRFGTVQASTGASGIPKPSVPEFTVKLVDSSYDVPTTYSTDPYTGEKITHPGYRVESRTIEIRIKNVPFTPFEIENGSNTYTAQFYYNIRWKGHYEEEWHEVYNPNVNGLLGRDSGIETVFSRQGEYSSTEGLKLYYQGLIATFPPGAQVDFQAQAMIGYIHHVVAMPFSADVFEGQVSGWSNTQTLTIGESQTPTPTPTPTPAPTPIQVPGQSSFSVESNSTVTELFFNSTSSELSFTVSGESETAGYVKVTIAKSFVSSVQNVKVYLDGNQLNVAITEDADSWLLNFNYMHSTHHVKISLATNAATTTFLGIEYWMWIGVATVIVVMGIGLLVYFKKRKH